VQLERTPSSPKADLRLATAWSLIPSLVVLPLITLVLSPVTLTATIVALRFKTSCDPSDTQSSSDLRKGVFFCLNIDKSNPEMKSTPREHKEALNRHATLVQHLIDEGYAQDEESANNIIMGMSEQWYSLIID